jgi:serine protease inhibitor ecotin
MKKIYNIAAIIALAWLFAPDASAQSLSANKQEMESSNAPAPVVDKKDDRPVIHLSDKKDVTEAAEVKKQAAEDSRKQPDTQLNNSRNKEATDDRKDETLPEKKH